MYDQASLLTFDAQYTPFKDKVIGTLTTNLGLPNIEKPDSLLRELRRITAGEFLAISYFFAEEDEANSEAIHKAGLETVLYKRTALELYAEAGWAVEVKNTCIGKASPTPPSVVLEGTRIDGLPVADANLEWCVLLGTGKGLAL